IYNLFSVMYGSENCKTVSRRTVVKAIGFLGVGVFTGCMEEQSDNEERMVMAERIREKTQQSGFHLWMSMGIYLLGPRVNLFTYSQMIPGVLTPVPVRINVQMHGHR
ncbi:MAG: hypothetical protein ABEK59_06915, partial [Halobacteria archaeon]